MMIKSSPIYENGKTIINYYEVVAPLLGYDFKLIDTGFTTQAILIKEKSCVSPIYLNENPILFKDGLSVEAFNKHLKQIKELNLEMYNWASYQDISVKKPAWRKTVLHYILDLGSKQYNAGLKQRIKKIPESLTIQKLDLTSEIFAILQETAKQKGFYNSEMEQKKFNFIQKSIETGSGFLFSSKSENQIVSVEFYLHTKPKMASLIFSGDVAAYRKQHLHPKALHLQFEILLASGFKRKGA